MHKAYPLLVTVHARTPAEPGVAVLIELSARISSMQMTIMDKQTMASSPRGVMM